jgi:hypothetical protein
MLEKLDSSFSATFYVTHQHSPIRALAQVFAGAIGADLGPAAKLSDFKVLLFSACFRNFFRSSILSIDLCISPEVDTLDSQTLTLCLELILTLCAVGIFLRRWKSLPGFTQSLHLCGMFGPAGAFLHCTVLFQIQGKWAARFGS